MEAWAIEYLQEIAIAEGREVPLTLAELVAEGQRELDALAMAGCPGIAERKDEREPFSETLYLSVQEIGAPML